MSMHRSLVELSQLLLRCLAMIRRVTLCYLQVWTVVAGLVSRLLRSLMTSLETDEAGDPCCPDAGAMVSEASVSVSLGGLAVSLYVTHACLQLD